ncbi:MAG TPA: NAD+ synthase, partial [Nitrospiraceae bacterium]|nr:NAD+ synthase [Nitrospiraceae bacterium]
DGQSLVVDERGEVICRGVQFAEDLIVVDLNLDAVFMQRLHDPRRRQQLVTGKREGVETILISGEKGARTRSPLPVRNNRVMDTTEEIYSALVLGTADYVL